jgi:hypothetical protein
MLLKKQLLSADNLNAAFLSTIATGNASIQSSLAVSGGVVSLKNTIFTDNANSGYLRIDPQGNSIVVYDGVNNQQFSVFSSSGSEYTYLTTINAASNQSYGLIDTSGTSVDHLEINTSSGKHIKISQSGIQWGKNGVATDNFHIVNDTTGSGRGFRLYNGNVGAGTQLLTILANGNMGIKTQSPAYPLHVVGDAYVTGNVRVAGQGQLLFPEYGGGFNMTDTSWVRVVGGKGFYMPSNIFRTDGTLQVGNTGATLNVVAGGNLTFDTNVIYGDATNNRVGINTTPAYPLDVLGDTRISGNGIITSNLTVAGGIKSYNIADTSTAGWVKLGTLTMPQGGYTAQIRIFGGSAYNGLDTQNSSIDLLIRTSNNSSTSASGTAVGAWASRNGASGFGSTIKLVQNIAGVGATAYDVHIQVAAFTGRASYEVILPEQNSSWTHIGTSSTTDPGVASSTVYIVPLYTQFPDKVVFTGSLVIPVGTNKYAT